MKICILSTSYPRTKDDYWVPFTHSWAKELAKTEDVTVVTSSGKGTKQYELRDNVKIHRFNYFYPKDMQVITYTGGMGESFRNRLLAKIQALFFMLSFIVKSLKIAKNCDVINTHWIPSGFAALPVKLLYKRPIVLTEHGGSIRSLPKWLNKFVLKRMDAVTSAHDDIIEAMKDMGIKNVINVKNFLNEDKFLKKHNIKSIKDELKIRNEYVVTFIGRFEPLKDPLTFVNSIPYVIKTLETNKSKASTKIKDFWWHRKSKGFSRAFVVQKIPRHASERIPARELAKPARKQLTRSQLSGFFREIKNVKFVMVGEGHLKGEIENQIKKLNIKNHIITPEPTTNVDKFLAISDIFIACSATENCFSTTILEAMLSKVPCIITKAGMTEKFFVHQKDAYLVEKKNPRLLGLAIVNLLKNKKLRKKLSQNGLNFLDRYGFRNKVIKKKIMKIFNEVMKA